MGNLLRRQLPTVTTCKQHLVLGVVVLIRAHHTYSSHDTEWCQCWGQRSEGVPLEGVRMNRIAAPSVEATPPLLPPLLTEREREKHHLQHWSQSVCICIYLSVRFCPQIQLAPGRQGSQEERGLGGRWEGDTLAPHMTSTNER